MKRQAYNEEEGLLAKKRWTCSEKEGIYRVKKQPQ
jgi:hypothetical protein